MVPFDLDQFDEAGKTAGAIEGIAKRFLGRAGMEREGSALVLSRLYTRCDSKVFQSYAYLPLTRDDTKNRLGGFITWGEEIILGSADLFLVCPCIATALYYEQSTPQTIGILQVVCEVTKTTPSDAMETHSSDLLKIARSVDNSGGFEINAIIRKLRTKAVAHAGVRLLSPRGAPRARRGEEGGGEPTWI
jgi:hypothetical protein